MEMHPKFQTIIDSLHPKFEALVEGPSFNVGGLPRDLPQRGIYLFSEGQEHLYVGRTNRLRTRIQSHCRPSGTHFSATFAFRIARADTGFVSAVYGTEGSRAALSAHPVFGPAFIAAKARVARMKIRCVEETNPVCQALLEIYIATVLGTPFNDFDNH